jgi:hypothetical protein
MQLKTFNKGLNGGFNKKIYVKITNNDECHNGFQYQDGLNIVNKPFEQTGSCASGGLYFTDLENVHNFYYYGVWLRIIEIPTDAQVVEDPDTTHGKKWRTDKMILHERYYLYDPETIKKFDLKITEPYVSKYVDLFSTKNQKNTELQLSFKNVSRALHLASANGLVKVLEWLKKSGLPLKYTEDALNLASQYGHVEVLDWWLNSKLPLKYDENALHLASGNGHVNVLDWWLNSKLPLKYTENALNIASENGHVKVLMWWFDSDLPLKYTQKALNMAFENGHVKVLTWWLKSNLPLKYSFGALHLASSKGYVNNQEWTKDIGQRIYYNLHNAT